MAWRTHDPSASVSALLASPENSRSSGTPRHSRDAARRALLAVVADVRAGLSETIGVGARLAAGERASVIVELPALPDELTPAYIARAIDSENVEAWCDERGQVHVAVSPWYSTKEVDQVVLSITKVAHVILGLHASDTGRTGKNFWQRWLQAALEIVELQKRPHRR